MHCATPFLKRAQVSERECDDACKAVLQFTKREFESMLTLRPPHAPPGCGDLVAQMRTMNSATEQQIAIKEKEVEALRIAILHKHAELVRIKGAKALKVKHTNDLLGVMNRIPHLPVEVILHIFGFLYYPESVDYKFGSVHDLSLYKISTGFADLPGWRKAIRSQIPLVLVPKSRDWGVVSRQLSPPNQLALGLHPRLCDLDDLPALAQVGACEPAAAYLAVDAPEFQDHLAAARHFKLRSLILSASNLQRLSGGLSATSELLWRIESLEVLVNRQFMHNNTEFLAQEQQFQGSLEPLKPIGIADPCLRHACLPWSVFQNFKPLIIHVISLELVIPSDGSNVGNVLKSLQCLPTSITQLTLQLEFRPRDPPSEDFIYSVNLPNLIELAVKGFDSRATTALIKGIDGPNLQSLVAKPDISYMASMFDAPDEASDSNPWSNDNNDKIHLDFLEIAHSKFPALNMLKYASPLSAMRSGTPFLHYLKQLDAIEGADGERGWLLPKLEVLDIIYDGEDVLDLVIALVSARLKSDKVSSLRSVILPSLDPQAQRRKRDVADVWRDTQLNALRVLVPDLKIVSSHVLDFY